MAYSCSYVPKCCQMKKHELWVSELELELQLTSLPGFHKAEGDMDSVLLEVVTQQLKSMQAEWEWEWEYFVTVFTAEDTSCIPEIEDNLGAKKSEEINISREKMLMKFKGPKSAKSPEPEGRYPRVLKKIAAEIVDALAMIFQKFLRFGNAPMLPDLLSDSSISCFCLSNVSKFAEETQLGGKVSCGKDTEKLLIIKTFPEVEIISSDNNSTGKFTVTGPTHPVVAIVGEDAVLECRLVPDLSASNIVVRWLKSDLGSAVHAYRNGEDDTAAQDHDYRGRTEQFKDELSKGNVSLRIKNTRVFDEGKYICSVDDETDFEETVIELKVGGLGREHWIQIEGYHQNGIQLVCESNGWFPQPQVLWTGGDGQNLTTQSKINYHRDSKGLVNVQSNVAVTRDSTNRFKCLIRNNLLKKEQEATIQIAGDFFPAISGWLVFLSVILSLVIVALAAGNIWTVKQHRYFKELEVDKSIKQFDQWKSLIDSDWKKISECQVNKSKKLLKYSADQAKL
ncbi:butyrophilin subfamily 3 member A2-like [Heterodontus francisci]|uniref:butyrophilin subfamily 3 member A2-like n=1 Tax=Heterodontus francisci TaxID=7792 RepID=UPI00355AFFFA